ncbi:hypothetical protein F5Y13DRAFT_199912 [Hypoxylon sp. FL1857]|nr:hypothetical protein F5Y13DRAFT_199912 [Hypoxylon sp. FL1857]
MYRHNPGYPLSIPYSFGTRRSLSTHPEHHPSGSFGLISLAYTRRMETLDSLVTRLDIDSDETSEPEISHLGQLWETLRRLFSLEKLISKVRGKSMNQPAVNVQACSGCGDILDTDEMALAPCGHWYCRLCLHQLFLNAATDEAYFPPRCCRQQIPLEENIPFLEPDLVVLYRAKAVEYYTPRRTYCHRKDCSAFLPPANYLGDNTAFCDTCRSETCILCKGPAHPGEECARDENLEKVLELARVNGWRQCPNCGTLIERATGCYHMTCRCRAEFCYLCSKIWGTCECQWISNGNPGPMYGRGARDILAARQERRENPYYWLAAGEDLDSEGEDDYL